MSSSAPKPAQSKPKPVEVGGLRIDLGHLSLNSEQVRPCSF